MLTIRESNKILKALPLNGYQLISDKLAGEYGTEYIRKVIKGSKYNQKIVDAALAVIEDFKLDLSAQKEKIKLLQA